MDINEHLFQWFITFFDKKSSGSAVKSEIMSNQRQWTQFAQQTNILPTQLMLLRSLTIRNNQLKNYTNQRLKNKKLQKLKIYSSFKENIWGADLAHIQSTHKCNKGFWFLLCVTDIFSKYEWVAPLKEKKLQLLMLSKMFQMSPIENQTKYGQIKLGNFTIDPWNHGSNIDR